MNLRGLSRYWLLVPLLLGAIVVRDWAERPETFEAEETIDMRASEADYYLEDFTTRRFDANGTLEYIVSGRTLSHFPDDGRSEVEAPRVELRRPEAVWRVSAERGRLDIDPDVFTLLGDVRLERAVGAGAPGDAPDDGSSAAEVLSAAAGPADPPASAPPLDAPSADAPSADAPLSDGPLTILASDLSVGLDSDEISTDAAFEIVADTWRLSGVGLRSNIDEGKLMLLSDVYGTYDAAAP